jgi:hypothetical protein
VELLEALTASGAVIEYGGRVRGDRRAHRPRAVSARAELSYGFVCRLMGGYDLTLSVVLRLAAALEVKPSQLIDGIEGSVRQNGHGPGFPKAPRPARSDVRATLV